MFRFIKWLILLPFKIILVFFTAIPSLFNAMFGYSREATDGRSFEFVCAGILENKGFSNVKVTQSSGDQGVDVIAYLGFTKYAIQCKFYSDSVGNSAVQEVFAGMGYYNCSKAIVMTNSTFTASAKDLAKSLGVELWENVPCGVTRKANKKLIVFVVSWLFTAVLAQIFKSNGLQDYMWIPYVLWILFFLFYLIKTYSNPKKEENSMGLFSNNKSTQSRNELISIYDNIHMINLTVQNTLQEYENFEISGKQFLDILTEKKDEFFIYKEEIRKLEPIEKFTNRQLASDLRTNLSDIENLLNNMIAKLEKDMEGLSDEEKAERADLLNEYLNEYADIMEKYSDTIDSYNDGKLTLAEYQDLKLRDIDLLYQILGGITKLGDPALFLNSSLLENYIERKKEMESFLDMIKKDSVPEKNNSTEKEKIDLLREYKALLDDGIITQEEFEQKKKSIL